MKNPLENFFLHRPQVLQNETILQEQPSLQNTGMPWGRYDGLMRYFALAGVLLVMFLRAPSFFLTPRIWAEEGVFYFSNAYHYAHTALWYRGIFYILGGYLNLWTGMATTAAANLVSVENAPYVTAFFATVAQLIPAAIILWSSSSFWRQPIRKVAGILILLFTPLSGEIWITTTQSQVFFTLATFLLLLEDTPTTAVRRLCYRTLLVLGGLTGPGSCILTPMFLIEAYRGKHRERIIQAGLLTACALIQAVLMYFFSATRVNSGVFSLRAYILAHGTQSVGLVFLGVDKARQLSDAFLDIHRQGGFKYTATVLSCLFVLSLIFLFISRGVPSKERRLLVGTYLLLTLVSFYGAIGALGDKFSLIYVGAGTRYFFVPNVIFLLLILARIRKPFRFGSIVATMLLVLSITLGVVGYKKTLTREPDWPQWQDEVRAWRENPKHRIAIWPSPGWCVELRK